MCHLVLGIQVRLEHYPDAARQKDERGELPLSLACRNGTLEEEEVLELLELLVRVYPEAVDVEDNDGVRAIDLETYGRLPDEAHGKTAARKEEAKDL